MYFAKGAATTTITKSVSAWTIPATGDVAPRRMLVAVRAIAPVAGMPPKSGTTRLARPWATSSTSGLCRSPHMLSATTAESRLSIAASIATVNAEGKSGRIRSARNSGSASAGSPVGMPPNLVPIVPTWMPAKTQAMVVATRAMIMPGSFFVTRGHRRIMATVATETTTVGVLSVAALSPARSSAGRIRWAHCRPPSRRNL